MLLLLFINQPAPPAASYVNLAVMAKDLWPPLNAVSEADAIFWSEAELYQWINDAVNRLADNAPLFVVYDQSLAAATGVGAYAQPSKFIATLQADLAGTVLRARNVQQLEALDDNWPTSAGTPEAFALDSQGERQLRLYKTPSAPSNGLLVGQVMQTLPATVNASNAILAAPTCLREYLSFSALAEARAKETRAQMPEISAWLRGLVGMMDKAIVGYWGNS